MIVEHGELARRSYALETLTLGEDNFLQIRCGGEIIVTVSAISGPTVEEFAVFNGTGMGEDDDEDPTLIVKRFEIDYDVQEAWRAAARFGYLHALGKMMTRDAREDRGHLG